VQEAVDGELRDPDRIEDGKVGGLPVGDRMGQRLVERRQRHGHEVDLNVVRSGVVDELAPGAFGDDDAHLGLVGAPAQPVRIHERPAATVAEDHAFVRELREGAAHGRPADPVLVAELVFGRETVARAVAAAENLLQEERLQLVVERDRLLGIDRHLGAEPWFAIDA
jgi:hypothetical protein